MRNIPKSNADVARRNRITTATLVALGALAGPAHAINIDTADPDLKLSWDNTVRYTLDDRVQKQSSAILSQPNIDDGDRNFKRGIVSDRFDLLSEADLVYKDYYGVRVSGQAWHDFAYDGALADTSTATYNRINANGQQILGLSGYANRYFHGTSAEFLDAFAFARVPIADMPLDLKIGRHSIAWGESLFPAANYNSVAYSQQPLDLARAASMPGVEAKEFYRPLDQVSASWQVAPTLTLMGQYYLAWETFRFPEGGTYLGNGDFFLNGRDLSLLVPQYNPTTGALTGFYPVPRGADDRPRNAGNYGLAARWSPDWAAATFGFYYRRFSDKLPQTYLTAVTVPTVGVVPTGYHFAYADKIDMFGLSFTKNIDGVSVGSELSFRHNMPLNSDIALVMPGSPINAVVPGAELITGQNLSRGQMPGARGNTLHGLANAIYAGSGSLLWDQFTAIGELNFDHWLDVTSGEQWFQGRPGRTGIDNVSKTSVGMSLALTPAWYHLIPGTTLSAPFSVTYGLAGNSAVFLGNAKGGGTYGGGISADVRQQYSVSLQYVGFFGRTSYANGVLTAAGTNATLKDRGFVALTFKTTF